VYFGYFLIAIPAGWFLHRYGYKKGILLGLFLFAAGALLFLPASSARSYGFFLTALFIIASGATFLETVANPYMSKLGDPSTSERRLNFAQSFNGLGAAVAPIIGGRFILSGIEYSPAELKAMQPGQLQSYLQSEANTLRIPYLVIAAIALFVALLFVFTRLPETKESDAAQTGESFKSFSLRVFRYPHVRWAVIAEFFYVGAQVGVGSFFIRFSRYVMDMPEKRAAYLWGYVAMAGFMVGRFGGTFLMKYIKPARLLSLYAAINILLLLTALSQKGPIAVYALMAVPFFMSIMFPTIFALGIKGLGEETKIVSSFLVMSIVGGAFIPMAMGLISDRTGSIQLAYIMPLLCFIIILYFGWRGYRIRQPEMSQALQTKYESAG
jgi:FHS family L-fucose permease-like MFS transporter